VRRGGATALSGRAVTAESGVANGVLHRHFATVDALFRALIDTRLEGIAASGAALVASAGTGSVEDKLVETLPTLMDATTVVIATAAGATALVAREQVRVLDDYLSAECAFGRLAPDTDTLALALALVGSTHLMTAAPELTSAAAADYVPEHDPTARLLSRIVRATLADGVQNRLP
jgi:AcrR family transcriptional regulator